MKKINTLSELKQERKRLLQRKAELELNIKTNFHELKEEMEPGRIIGKAFKTMGNDENLFSYTIGTLTSIIVNKIILRKSGFLTKFTASYLAKNFTTKILSEKKGTIFNWLTSLFQKVTKEKSGASEKTFVNVGYQ